MISLISVESQPQNPEFRNNPEKVHPCRGGNFEYTNPASLQKNHLQIDLANVNFSGSMAHYYRSGTLYTKTLYKYKP